MKCRSKQRSRTERSRDGYTIQFSEVYENEGYIDETCGEYFLELDQPIQAKIGRAQRKAVPAQPG